MADLHQKEVPSESPAMTTDTPPSDSPKPVRGMKRTLIIWLRVIALLFAGLFFLSKCGMSKSDAKIKIMESCIQNVPYYPKWKQALAERKLPEGDERMVADYCICMWNDPLQKLGVKQIQSFPNLSQEEQLNLLGGEKAFIARDKQCMDGLKPSQ